MNVDDAETKERLRAVVRECLSEWAVEVLWHVGPEKLSLRGSRPRLPALRVWKPTKLDTEMVIDCDKDPPSERLCRWLRSPKRRTFQVAPVAAGGLRAAHYKMIDQFFASREPTPFLFNLACQLMTLTTSPCCTWLEAREGDELAGLAAMVDAFDSMCLAVFQTTDARFSTASDTLHAAMREMTVARGKRYLNLGPSPEEGHYRFKKKWGGFEHHPPYWWQAWGRSELASLQNDSWPARLLGATGR
jgi:hypothetical protein